MSTSLSFTDGEDMVEDMVKLVTALVTLYKTEENKYVPI